MLKTATEIIKESWELCSKNWRKFVPILAILLLPSVVLSALGTMSLYLEVYLPKSWLISSLVLLAVLAASLLLTFWGSIALLRALAMANSNQAFDWKSLFSTSSNLLWPVFWTSFLASLIVLGGSLLLVVPGIIFAIWYNFAIYTVVFENARGLAALRASKDLVVGRWGAIFWRWLALGIVFIILNSVVSYVIASLIKILPLPMFIESSLFRIGSSFISVVFAPLVAGAALILYQSAKQNPVTQQPAPTSPTK